MAGNTSDKSAEVLVTVDDSVPSEFISPRLEQGADISLVHTHTLVVVGTAPQGTVSIYDAAENLLGTSPSLGGLFRVTSASLADGSYHVVARVTGVDGHVGDLSEGLDVTIDTTPPATPGIPTTTDSASVSRPTFSGSALAGTRVEIIDGSFVVGWGIATVQNTYAVQVNALVDGSHSIRARFVDPAGNPSNLSDPLVVFINHGGLVAAIQGNLEVDEGQAVSLTGIYSDTDTGAHTFAWQVTGNVSQVTGANTAALSFVPDASGSYQVQLTVTNAQNATSVAGATEVARNVVGTLSNLVALVYSDGGEAALTGEIVGAVCLMHSICASIGVMAPRWNRCTTRPVRERSI